jgi:hypothetical protein
MLDREIGRPWRPKKFAAAQARPGPQAEQGPNRSSARGAGEQPDIEAALAG